jgi:hypothetical protein
MVCKECKEKRVQEYHKRWEEERKKGMFPKEKKCRDCQQVKPVSDYTKDKNRKDGLSHLCKDCKNKMHRRLAERWEKERDAKKDTPLNKSCRRCKRTLPILQFGLNIRSKDGFSSICRSCNQKRSRENKKKWEKERLENPINICEKECPRCRRILDINKFYTSLGHKDGYSYYCKECELKNQRKAKDKWELERASEEIKIPKEKRCIMCQRVLPASNFYKNRALKDGLHSLCKQCEKGRSSNYIKKWNEDRIDESIVEEMECVTCHRILPVSQFYRNKRNKSGLTSSCIDCEKKRATKYIERWSNERVLIVKDVDFSLFPVFEKKCISCNRILGLSHFYKKQRSKDGLSSNCIECELKYVKERRLIKKRAGFKPNIPEVKYCKICQKTLPSSEFHKNCDSSDGLAWCCRDCKNKKQKEYFSKPEVKEKWRRYAKEYRKRPGVREHERERARNYSKRPYVQEKRRAYYKEYYSRPEVIERRKEYLKEYHSRPEVIEKVKLKNKR